MRWSSMSSLPWAAYNTTVSVIKDMASADVFTAKGDDNSPRIAAASVVSRFSVNQQLDITERGIELPGLVITYLGWRNSLAGGSFCQDDGNIRLSVQLVDSGDIDDEQNVESYMNWMHAIREWLQTNPFERADYKLGHIYLVHVDDQTPPEADRWALLREMRMHVNVNCLTRSRRNKDQKPWVTT